MKIKSRPEDFKVEEVARIELLSQGPFGVYLLTKNGLNTVELLESLGRRLKLPARALAYGGKKDRHGLTSQFITIEGRKRDPIEEKGFSLQFQGYADRPMGPDLIEGNSFSVTVRKLTQEKVNRALEELALAQRFGLPNYFDDQRFGSYDPLLGFLGERVLKGHFNGAVKALLISGYSEDRKEVRERKQFFTDHWRDWGSCAQLAVTSLEQETFAALRQDPNGFLPVLKRIPREKLSLYFSAYQSFLWNETVRRLLGASGCSLPGQGGGVPVLSGTSQGSASSVADAGGPHRRCPLPDAGAFPAAHL
jgi:tRNA pseudouridine13 synthase